MALVGIKVLTEEGYAETVSPTSSTCVWLIGRPSVHGRRPWRLLRRRYEVSPKGDF